MSASKNANDAIELPLDPVFLSARREAIVVLAIFGIFAIYVLSVCYALGSDAASEEGDAIATIMGMPAWVFWGIVVPWGAANVVTAWFCFYFMKNESLEDASIETDDAHD